MLADGHSAGRVPAECYQNASGALAFLHQLDVRGDQPSSRSWNTNSDTSVAMQEALVGDQVGLSILRTNTKRAHRGKNAVLKLLDCSGSLSCVWYLSCPKTQNKLTKSESRFLFLARCLPKNIRLSKTQHRRSIPEHWSRRTEARCPLNLCITFMHHMYGHDGDRKLLVLSR